MPDRRLRGRGSTSIRTARSASASARCGNRRRSVAHYSRYAQDSAPSRTGLRRSCLAWDDTLESIVIARSRRRRGNPERAQTTLDCFASLATTKKNDTRRHPTSRDRQSVWNETRVYVRLKPGGPRTHKKKK